MTQQEPSIGRHSANTGVKRKRDDHDVDQDIPWTQMIRQFQDAVASAIERMGISHAQQLSALQETIRHNTDSRQALPASRPSEPPLFERGRWRDYLRAGQQCLDDFEQRPFLLLTAEVREHSLPGQLLKFYIQNSPRYVVASSGEVDWPHVARFARKRMGLELFVEQMYCFLHLAAAKVRSDSVRAAFQRFGDHRRAGEHGGLPEADTCAGADRAFMSVLADGVESSADESECSSRTATPSPDDDDSLIGLLEDRGLVAAQNSQDSPAYPFKAE